MGRGCTGIDISETAVKRARELHPKFNFYVGDLLNINLELKYDLVICKEVLWYVVFDLELALKNLKKLVNKNGLLYISLSFPRLENNFLGKKILSSPESLLKILELDFESIAQINLLKYKFREDGHNFHWLGKKLS